MALPAKENRTKDRLQLFLFCKPIAIPTHATVATFRGPGEERERGPRRASMRLGNAIESQFVLWTELLTGEELESDEAAALENISPGTASVLVTRSVWV